MARSSVAEMDDLDWLNTRRPKEGFTEARWIWWTIRTLPNSALASDDLPDDVFDALIGGWLSPSSGYHIYPSEGEAMAALYAAWEAARPGTFPLVKACECETCRGEQ